MRTRSNRKSRDFERLVKGTVHVKQEACESKSKDLALEDCPDCPVDCPVDLTHWPHSPTCAGSFPHVDRVTRRQSVQYTATTHK